jgi:hypothetical protein
MKERFKGFRVVNTKTGAVLSEDYARRADARAKAAEIEAAGTPCGVQHISQGYR